MFFRLLNSNLKFVKLNQAKSYSPKKTLSLGNGLVKVISILTTVFLLACDRFTQGQKKNQAPQSDIVKIQFKEGECLAKVPQQLSDFLNDRSVISPSIQCVQKALTSFAELTRGEDKNSYSAKELQDFFNTYLLKENKISFDFLKDIMNFKVLVSGGSSDTVTRAELRDFVEFLGQFAIQLDSLNGRIKMLTLKADPSNVTMDKLISLRSDVNLVMTFLIQRTHITQNQYSMGQFNLFLENLKLFLGSEQSQLNEFLKWMPLINGLRELLIGDRATFNSNKDWLSFNEWISRSYFTLLKYQYIYKFENFKTPEKNQNLISLIDEIFFTIESSPALSERKIFEAIRIDNVINQIEKMGLLNLGISSQLLKESYRKAVVYFIESVSSQANSEAFRGITASHIQGLKAEYNIWKATQNLINRSFIELKSQPTSRSLLKLQETIDGFGFPQVPANDAEEYKNAYNDFRKLLSKPNALYHDGTERLFISDFSLDRPLNFRGTSQLNFLRSISRMVLRGYGNRDERAIFKRTINQNSFVRLEADFHEFAVVTGLVDPDKASSGKETFEQGKMLIFSSNGDEVLDAFELTDLFATLFSGGKTILDLVYKDLEKRRCLLNEKDVFGRYFVDEKCFISAFQARYAQYFSNMPVLVSAWSRLNSQEILNIYNDLMTISLSTRHKQGVLESGEIRTLFVILHYVEEIFMVYDKDRTGLLNTAEVESAYPRFQEIIKKEAAKKGFLASLIPQSIFKFLVFEGRIPTESDLVIQWIEGLWSTSKVANRQVIYKLLVTMNNILNANNRKLEATVIETPVVKPGQSNPGLSKVSSQTNQRESKLNRVPLKKTGSKMIQSYRNSLKTYLGK